MSRDLTVAMETAFSEDVVRPVILALIELDGVTIALNTGLSTIIYDGHTYLGVGTFGNVVGLEETSIVSPTGIKLTLSGLPTEYVALIVGSHYQGRPAKVYVGLLNEQHELIADPMLGFQGHLDYADVEMGDRATITLSAESTLVDWSRGQAQRITHASQQALYPTDMGLEFVAKMQDIPIKWGVA